MTVWTIPKTDWTGSKNEYFNIDPDYIRIKHNILHLHELAQSLYANFSIYEMEEVTHETIPYVDFFNHVVYNIDLIVSNSIKPEGYSVMNIYNEGGNAWDYKDLNRIENNILLIKLDLERIKNAKTKLPIKLGGREL